MDEEESTWTASEISNADLLESPSVPAHHGESTWTSSKISCSNVSEDTIPMKTTEESNVNICQEDIQGCTSVKKNKMLEVINDEEISDVNVSQEDIQECTIVKKNRLHEIVIDKEGDLQGTNTEISKVKDGCTEAKREEDVQLAGISCQSFYANGNKKQSLKTGENFKKEFEEYVESKLRAKNRYDGTTDEENTEEMTCDNDDEVRDDESCNEEDLETLDSANKAIRLAKQLEIRMIDVLPSCSKSLKSDFSIDLKNTEQNASINKSSLRSFGKSLKEGDGVLPDKSGTKKKSNESHSSHNVEAKPQKRKGRPPKDQDAVSCPQTAKAKKQTDGSAHQQKAKLPNQKVKNSAESGKWMMSSPDKSTQTFQDHSERTDSENKSAAKNSPDFKREALFRKSMMLAQRLKNLQKRLKETEMKMNEGKSCPDAGVTDSHVQGLMSEFSVLKKQQVIRKKLWPKKDSSVKKSQWKKQTVGKAKKKLDFTRQKKLHGAKKSSVFKKTKSASSSTLNGNIPGSASPMCPLSPNDANILDNGMDTVNCNEDTRESEGEMPRSHGESCPTENGGMIVDETATTHGDEVNSKQSLQLWLYFFIVTQIAQVA